MKTPIGIIRKIDGPRAVMSHRGDMPSLERKRFARMGLELMRVRYEFQECPLEEADPCLFPARNGVLKAWRVLNTRDATDPMAMREASFILRETTPSPDEKAPVRRERDAWTALFAEYIIKPARGRPRDFLLRILPAARTALRESAPGGRRLNEDRFVRDLLARYWSLSLHEDAQLLAATARLVALAAPDTTLEWLDVLMHQPRERRETFSIMLMETGAYRESPPDWLIPYSPELNALIDDKLHAFRLQAILSPDGRACRPDYLANGFRLANRFAENFPFSFVDHRGEGESSHLMRLCESLEGAEGFYDELPLRFWEKSARLPGINAIIRRLDWSVFSRDTNLALLRLFMDCPPRSWELLRKIADEVHRELLGLSPVYRPKAIAIFARALECRTDKIADPGLVSTRELIRRICAKPFTVLPEDMKPALALLLRLPETGRGRMINCGVNSLKALEKICSSSNRASLAAAGLGLLARRMPEFALTCFERFPARLMKSAELLGTFSRDIAGAMLNEFGRSPIMLYFENEGCLDLDRLRRWAYPRLFNPLPARLLAHFRGERELNQRALNADLEKAHRDIALLRLEVLDEMLRARLAMGIAPAQGEEHSLRMLRIIDSNIRTLKRFLRARARGRGDFLREHPANRAWLRSLPELPGDLWRGGFSLRRSLSRGGSARLCVEQDPDEILKMGTYFDTCLGLGGVNAFSAAAVLLDENKQVVYARDDAGRPLGRQLLAISEQGRLVCFEVYAMPDLEEELEELFQYYDQLFARRLGLPLHDNEKMSYEIRLLVAEEWYDDGVWVPEGFSRIIALT